MHCKIDFKMKKKYFKPTAERYECEPLKPLAFSVSLGDDEEEDIIIPLPEDSWDGIMN